MSFMSVMKFKAVKKCKHRPIWRENRFVKQEVGRETLQHFAWIKHKNYARLFPCLLESEANFSNMSELGQNKQFKKEGGGVRN